jgi:hypothetical protein
MEDFKYQLSIKVGPHLLNLRSAEPIEFLEELKFALENAEAIQACVGAFEKPEHSHSVVATAPRPIEALKSTSGEIGPVRIKSVTKALLNTAGSVMDNPRYVVTLENGKIVSTFNASIGGSAEKLAGEPVFYTTATNGKYTNLASVRKAS